MNVQSFLTQKQGWGKHDTWQFDEHTRCLGLIVRSRRQKWPDYATVFAFEDTQVDDATANLEQGKVIASYFWDYRCYPDSKLAHPARKKTEQVNECSHTNFEGGKKMTRSVGGCFNFRILAWCAVFEEWITAEMGS